MLKSGEEILHDIDATLDQLIENAKAITTVSLNELQDNEIVAVQKTQESLLSRLIHMNELLNSDNPGGKVGRRTNRAYDFDEKIAEFSRLNTKLINEVALHYSKEQKPRYIRKMRAHTKRGRSTALTTVRN